MWSQSVSGIPRTTRKPITLQCYPEVLKILDKVLDGTPKVQVSDVISSTIHEPAAVAA